MRRLSMSLLSIALLLCAIPSISLAQQTQFLNFQKVAFYNSRSENKFYLVVYATDESTRSGKLDTDNVHIMFQTDSNKRVVMRRNDLVVVNLGQLVTQLDQKHTFFRFNMVIDNSGSIDDVSLSHVEEILTKFINNLPVVFEAQVIKFSHDIKKSSFTKDKNQLKQFIQEPYVRGNTALYDAVASAVEELKFAGDDIPLRFSVILTDGKDTASQRYKDRDVFKQYIVAETRSLNIPIFVVGVTDEIDEPLLKDISKFGLYQQVPGYADIDGAFEIINKIINDTYIIKIPSISRISEIGKLLIVKESAANPGKYETIQDILLR